MTSLEGGWWRALQAGEAVFERARRAAAALDAGGVPHAMVGGNAVAEWVRRADDGADRYTRDVNILVRRADLSAAEAAMGAAGFGPTTTPDGPGYTDGSEGGPRAAVRFVIADEPVRPNHLLPAPDVSESERGGGYQVIGLEPLVRMKLVSHRTIDRVHLRDLIGVGLIDATWPARFPPPLDARLQAVLDDPDG